MIIIIIFHIQSFFFVWYVHEDIFIVWPRLTSSVNFGFTINFFFQIYIKPLHMVYNVYSSFISSITISAIHMRFNSMRSFTLLANKNKNHNWLLSGEWITLLYFIYIPLTLKVGRCVTAWQWNWKEFFLLSKNLSFK